MSNCTPFSYVILVLVGEGGAGPHDLVRMMRDGRVYWTAPESQYYAEPKRLAKAGFLAAAKQPGRTHAKTHYTLTDQGRDALTAWLATPPASLASRTRPSFGSSPRSTPIGGSCSKALPHSNLSSTSCRPHSTPPPSVKRPFHTAHGPGSQPSPRGPHPRRPPHLAPRGQRSGVKGPLQPFRSIGR